MRRERACGCAPRAAGGRARGGAGGARACGKRAGAGGSPGPAALPRHVKSPLGAAVLILRERELSRRALPLAGAANLTARPGAGQCPMGVPGSHSEAAASPGDGPPARLDQWLRRAGPRGSGLADGSVPLFPPWPLEPNVKEGRKEEGGAEKASAGEGEITVEMPLCVSSELP